MCTALPTAMRLLLTTSTVTGFPSKSLRTTTIPNLNQSCLARRNSLSFSKPTVCMILYRKKFHSVCFYKKTGKLIALHVITSSKRSNFGMPMKKMFDLMLYVNVLGKKL
ncbi:hypothetical protein NC653_031190 [Populus alba x Populus x berolinensis]|uniref:Secreted protein n=1 Tax=Populus alba x Populus x berolinensis TaxID=444605 RepID=A0AAD6LY67_9ROSI|nr:hypothetical protein NC653_031190 [Populus alba x Populus x berolinensis]